MKAFRSETQFNFGIHEGLTLLDIASLNPEYLSLCLINMDHFFIHDDTLEAIRKSLPDFVLTERAEEVRMEKMEEWDSVRVNTDPCIESKQIYEQWEMEDADWNYDPMNLAYDQDENPWIDVFGPGDEAETAYWNTN
jgi:hypothetical protein